MGKKQFCFFQTAETGNRTPDSGVKGSGANHYPRAPALKFKWRRLNFMIMSFCNFNLRLTLLLIQTDVEIILRKILRYYMNICK